MKALKNTITDLKLPQDGDTILLPRRIHLRHHDGNQAANCGQLGAGIRGTRHPGLNSFFFLLSLFRDVISLAGDLISWQSTGVCRQHTHRVHDFLMHSCCTDLFLLVVRVYSHILTSCTCMAQVTKHIVCVSPKNTHISSRNVVHLATFDDTKHGHSFLSFPEPVFQRAEPLRRSTATAEWRFG